MTEKPRNDELLRVEETLDPQNWDEMRALGRQMVDDAFTFLETVRDRPVWQPIPAEVKQFLRQPLPLKPEDPKEVYQQFVEHILAHPMGNIHPRFWGWVIGTGDPVGSLAEMLAATLNPNMGGGDHVANYVEQQVLDWLKEIMGFPADAGALLVSGGSMANMVGLTVARNQGAKKAGVNLRKVGLQGLERRMTLYCSTQTHSSVQKSVELPGLGSDALREIAVDANFRMRLDLLRGTIDRDRQQDFLPCCVIGNAGTTNTGAFDDLRALADLCQEEGIWYHVDGAFGALVRLSPELAPMAVGMERADSLAFDLHKWMDMPIEIGCALVRNEGDQRESFSLTPDYLTHAERGLAGGKIWFSDLGVQLTRSFRALKAWMMLKTHGSEKFGRIIRQNVEQAHYLSQLVDATPSLERLAPTALNTVCFRYVGQQPQEDLNALNQELLTRLHERGIAVPTYTTIDGKYALRVCNVNHRTLRSDFELLAAAVIQLGQELERETVHQ